ncbi:MULTISPECIES: alpha/beta fold hydrolase [Oscillatoriales]|jgi:pimeloyl-ACP methyl ester carboxylesterase|uniref:AB hydrolase-1 domain-containing protein n=1 Tax=Limnospira platensis NIES-46 TaxID=1236695 RepID=A0A5M3T376_LIMPL|nr:alpha/beta fold hydrolase [Arthrospira platensis]AMW27699.1 alpha/beta hydrolase [Arthrospira platensis YZ]KDR58314.1 alpha/beta hydrolase [Arthrospira platensis str. Paraca]MBD2669399.1 alpha/beta fold hydrolase [Arthrospira platensis FACHB-439]MDF2210584.1 alpha/beta fold hydrolase [Arthrospira platensis NCB002]MDT9185642.1 alpha/beta fold hydrolase [Limnospira sp. PMC 289.06]MDT9295032.1 alpha/beta fold hydrolase [Arthrospira platensis PCC 7345]MDT9310583.1 alpha/beta fold hydrolase [L
MQTTLVTDSNSYEGTYWKWRDQLIYYVRGGSAGEDVATTKVDQRPSLLLVHGFGASTDHWRKNIEGLSSEFDVWAIDLLGFGRSAKPDWEYTGQLWRDQLHDFMTEVIGRPTVLAGNSLGGYASLCVAADYPDGVAGLILLNSAGPFSDTQTKIEPPTWKQKTSRMMRSLLIQDWTTFLVFQWTRRRSVIRKTLQKVYLDQSAVTDRLVEEIYRPSCTPGAAKVFASVFKSRQGDPVDVLLSRLRCPLLMLWGEGDPWMNCRARSDRFREYYPQLTEYFLNAGHCPHDEIPEQVNNLIQNWVLVDILTGLKLR